MARFQNGVLGMVQEADLLQTGFMVSRPNDPLEGLFTDQQTDNLVAEWYTIASKYQIPQMAQFHAFDTISQKAERAPIDERNVEKGLIKVKRNTSEMLRQLMHRGITQESEMYRLVMRDEVADLADQVVTRAKVARHELMATGTVTIKENNVDLTVDYGVPANHKNLAFDTGNGATKDPLTQLQEIVDAASDEGVELNGMVCARSFLTALRKNSVVMKAINGNASDGVLVRNSALTQFLADEFGITQIVVDDLKYAEPWTELDAENRPKVTTHRYYPANKVTFFGTVNGMRLGTGLWGQPPEVEIANFAQVSQSSESPFVYITQWADKDPAVLWTKASALYMPVLYAPQSLFIATVTNTPGA